MTREDLIEATASWKFIQTGRIPTTTYSVTRAVFLGPADPISSNKTIEKVYTMTRSDLNSFIVNVGLSKYDILS